MTNQSVNGIRSGTLSVYVDGSDNLATGGGGHSFVNINPDAIAEFRVLTSNYSAEYGQSGGAVMNQVGFSAKIKAGEIWWAKPFFRAGAPLPRGE